uniref:Pollen-specific leucine-rich repeat extensin-like protein 1 n=1 Tax=Cicer arietinum TaxID=3827 RepID=A0A1S3DVH4_CICAR|nr:putative uncharacterized protein DDB_G0290521 [Cicer arietinum]
MLNAVVMGQSAPYGMILTKIFKFFKIPLEDEPFVHFNNTFSMKNIKQMKIQNDGRPVSEKRKACYSSSPSQKSEEETTQPPPEDTPSPLISEPTSPLRNSTDATPSPDSPVHTPPIHKLTPLHEADPLREDTFTPTPLQNMKDGEELYFDLNLSYPPSPTDVHMASPPTMPVDEDVLPPPDLSQPTSIPPATNFEKLVQPLPEVTGVFSFLDSFFTTTTHHYSEDKAGSSQNKSSNVNDQPKDSIPSKRTEERKNQKQMKLLKLISKDQKKILHSFTHY